MTMQRWDPFGEMMSLRQAMDRLMEDSIVRPRMASGAGGGMGIDLDVMEKGNDVVVKASIAGVKPEDINVSVERNVLTIRGEMREDQESGEGRYYHRERRWGSFSRSVMLPVDVDAQACDAHFEHGVLTITLPKSQQARARQIPIRGQSDREPIEGEKAGAARGHDTAGHTATTGSTTTTATGQTGTTGTTGRQETTRTT